MLRIALVTLALLWLPACQYSLPARESIAVSPGDQRQYAYLQLDNGLKVVLVSDPATPKAAASLDVFVGSAHDPADRQGLAHFLEHMLFLGTEKYPEPDGYQAFISAHGGSHNAYTSYEHTNYFFDIDKAAFPEALDRFAQFFIAPRMDAAYVERERLAVNSEYHARIRDESRRGLDAFLQLANPAHPLNRFSIGTVETLADRPGRPVRDDLLAFYRRYYAAPAMALSVVSDRPLDELRALVQELFSAVPARAVDRALAEVPLFEPGTLPKRLHVIPEQDRRDLTLVFPLPEVQSRYRSKPLAYIANLLGHEGEGSLLAFLKQQGWADGLSAGPGFNFSNGASLHVDIALTEAGLAEVDAITRAVFQAIQHIRSTGLEPWRYREQAQLAALQFRFLEKTRPEHYAIGLSNNLHHYPVADIVQADYLMDGLEADTLAYYLDYLVPDNVLVLVTAKGLPVDRLSPWFHAPYGVFPIAPAQLAEWRQAGVHEAIRSPAPNPFLPTRLALIRAAADGVPVRQVDEPGFQAWLLPHVQFRVPRGEVYIALYGSGGTAREVAMLSLYADLLADRLETALYPARLAGIEYSIAATDNGLQLRLGGFTDRQPAVLQALVAALREGSVDASAFARLKDARLRQWADSDRVMPFRRLVRAAPETLLTGRWRDAELAAALADIRADELGIAAAQWLQAVSVELLAHGNYDRAHWQSLLAEARPLATAAAARPPQAVRLPAAGSRERHAVPVLHDDAAVLVYVPAPAAGVEEEALMALSGQLLESPFFHQLRTEQQLGYAVRALAYPVAHVPGLAFLVQSPGHDVAAIEAAIAAFLEGAGADIDAAAFEGHRQALIRRYREPANNLQEFGARLWSELTVVREAGFDRRERVARRLETVTLAEWQDFLHRQVVGPESRQLLFYAAGRHGVEAAVLAPERGVSAATAATYSVRD